MQTFMRQALAGALSLGLIFTSSAPAFADRGGNGNGNGNAHAYGRTTVHASARTKVRGESSMHRSSNSVRRSSNSMHRSSNSMRRSSNAIRGNSSMRTRLNNNSNVTSVNNSTRVRGNSATAHSCINPAGNMRGWCKSHVNASFITGTVTAINGSTAIVTLANGQQVTINTEGRNLTVGQQITLRGDFGANGVFTPTNGNYTNYGGPFTSASVRGLIISVNGNSMQIVQGLSIITVDITNAVSRGAINGTLLPGRTITALGNWNGSTFVATSIQ